MNTQRITMVTLAVTDLQTSRDFYAALGWNEAAGSSEDIAFFQLHGQFMALYPRDAMAKDIGQAVPANATGAVTLATNYPDTESVDRAYQLALDAGAVAVSRPAKVFWGGYSGTLTDPDGHLWEYAYNPFWELDSDGTLKGDP